MKSTLRVGLSLIAISSLFAFVACGGDDDDDTTPAAHAGSGGEGASAHGGEGATTHGGADGHGGAAALALECKVLGTLCHEADDGSGTGMGHECHEVGHEGHADACAEEFGSCIAFCTAQDDGSGGAPAETKDAHCAALGELCHVVDDKTGPLHECHEVGHLNNAANCLAAFDECATLCLAAREALPPHTEGGAGGASAGGASAGGASLGGAGGGQ
jgi:hypothetical protein